MLARVCSTCGALLAHSATCVAAGASTSAVFVPPQRMRKPESFPPGGRAPRPFHSYRRERARSRNPLCKPFFLLAPSPDTPPVIFLSNRSLPGTCLSPSRLR